MAKGNRTGELIYITDFTGVGSRRVVLEKGGLEGCMGHWWRNAGTTAVGVMVEGCLHETITDSIINLVMQ